MCRARTSFAALAGLVAAAVGCGFSDEPFIFGNGAVIGRALDPNGAPVASCLVHYPARAEASTPVATDAEGFFRIPKLAVGYQEIVLRAPECDLGLRVEVLVAAGQTTDLGALRLDSAVAYEIRLRDAELHLKGAWVSWREIPGLNAETDARGSARFSGIPDSGDYRVQIHLPPFVFQPLDLSTDGGIASVLSVEPDREAGNYPHARLYHGTQRLAELQSETAACTSSCHIGAGWPSDGGPPCAWPVGAESFATDAADDLPLVVEYLLNTQLFTSDYAPTLSCPTPDELAYGCRSQRCQPTISEPLAEATYLDGGRRRASAKQQAWVETPEGVAGRIADLPANANLGQWPPPADSLFVYFGHWASTAPPRLIGAWPSDAEEEGGPRLMRLYYRGELSADAGPWTPSAERIQVGWSLYRLRFEPSTCPEPQQILPALAWLVLGDS